MVYSFLVQDGEALRGRLIANKVFVARYWPNVAEDGIHATECLLSNQCVYLPCDQRYTEEDMKRIVEIVRAA